MPYHNSVCFIFSDTILSNVLHENLRVVVRFESAELKRTYGYQRANRQKACLVTTA
jgi:hypothetical protein